MSATIRVLLADDQALVRGALAALLALESDLEVVAEVGRGDEVVRGPARAGADVCLLDIEMPGLDGIAAAAAVRDELPGCAPSSSRRSAGRATCGGRSRRGRRASSSRTPRRASSPTRCAGCTPACASSTPRSPPSRSSTAPTR